jgi:subtilisin
MITDMARTARALAGRDPVRRTLVVAMILGVVLAGWSVREEPVAAQAQTPDQQDAAAQTPPDGGSVTAVRGPQSSEALQLLDKARREGTVRAIVGLRTGFVPEGKLSRSQTADQRGRIASARAALLRADLSGTEYRTLREYETVSYVALKLTPQAFRAVQRSPHVSSITEDVAVPLALDSSTEVVQAPTMWTRGYTGDG